MRIENSAAQELARLSAARVPREEPAPPRVGPGGSAPPEPAKRPPAPEEKLAASEAPIAVDIAPIVQTARPRLRVDEATSRVIAQLIDENNEVIKQIPPQELLDIAARFREVRAILFDERA